MVYADYNGSAPVCAEVKKHLIERLENGPYANPNAIHSLGVKVMMGMEKCRRICAEALGASPNQIIFNSGSSEGISHVFFSLLPLKDIKKKFILLSRIEHSAVQSAAKYFESMGYELLFVKTLESGEIDLTDFNLLVDTHSDDIALVSIMAANNETGVIQPIKQIVKKCQENQVLIFSDTTQFIGKTEFNFKESGLDFAVLSGHKVGALVGSGILLAKEPRLLKAHIFGGGQENGYRGGTQNYIGIETLAIALKAFGEKKNKIEIMKLAREKFEKNIKQAFPAIQIIGDKSNRLASTTLISYPGIHGQAVQIELEAKNIFVTTSSACSDNDPHTSKVLKAMGIEDNIGRGVVRISLCLDQNPESYQEIEKALKEIYEKLAKIKSF